MAPYPPTPSRGSISPGRTRRCVPTARQRRSLKSDGELCSLIICLVAFTRLSAAKTSAPVVRQRLSWRIRATTLSNEIAFKRYYRMDLPTFEKLLAIVGPYLIVDFYQSLRRSRGGSPLSPAAMLQCALSWLAGGSYLHIRVITGISCATFYRVVYRVMFAVNDSDILAPKFPRSPEEMKDAAAGFQSLSNGGVIENCIGVIDGWLCPVKVPRKDECGRVLSFFSGHYQKYGLNVQACADHLSRFTAFSINSPGGMNDAYAFRRWKLSNLLRDAAGKYFVIGDNAYVQSKHILTPFNKAELVNRPDRDNYNFHRTKASEKTSLQLLQSMAQEACSWNSENSLDYDASEVELGDGNSANLMDEKVRTELVEAIASKNLQRPEHNKKRRQNESNEDGVGHFGQLEDNSIPWEQEATAAAILDGPGVQSEEHIEPYTFSC